MITCRRWTKLFEHVGQNCFSNSGPRMRIRSSEPRIKIRNNEPRIKIRNRGPRIRIRSTGLQSIKVTLTQIKVTLTHALTH